MLILRLNLRERRRAHHGSYKGLFSLSEDVFGAESRESSIPRMQLLPPSPSGELACIQWLQSTLHERNALGYRLGNPFFSLSDGLVGSFTTMSRG